MTHRYALAHSINVPAIKVAGTGRLRQSRGSRASRRHQRECSSHAIHGHRILRCDADRNGGRLHGFRQRRRARSADVPVPCECARAASSCSIRSRWSRPCSTRASTRSSSTCCRSDAQRHGGGRPAAAALLFQPRAKQAPIPRTDGSRVSPPIFCALSGWASTITGRSNSKAPGQVRPSDLDGIHEARHYAPAVCESKAVFRARWSGFRCHRPTVRYARYAFPARQRVLVGRSVCSRYRAEWILPTSAARRPKELPPTFPDGMSPLAGALREGGNPGSALCTRPCTSPQRRQRAARSGKQERSDGLQPRRRRRMRHRRREPKKKGLFDHIKDIFH